jgi:hypothetical protein
VTDRQTDRRTDSQHDPIRPQRVLKLPPAGGYATSLRQLRDTLCHTDPPPHWLSLNHHSKETLEHIIVNFEDIIEDTEDIDYNVEDLMEDIEDLLSKIFDDVIEDLGELNAYR